MADIAGAQLADRVIVEKLMQLQIWYFELVLLIQINRDQKLLVQYKPKWLDN